MPMAQRTSKYDGATLAPIVKDSYCLSDVIRRLGIKPNGGNHRHIAMRIRLAGLDTSHFRRGKTAQRIAAVPLAELTQLVRNSRSIAQVLLALGIRTEGRPSYELRARIQSEGLDTSHFRGRGWARGETKHTSPTLAKLAMKQRRPDSEVFVENSPETCGPRIVRRLLEMGWEYACRECEIRDWRGMPLALHLDHINGVNNDNRLGNLRLLCPNCHSQTPTYCGKAREDDLISKTWPCYTKRHCERDGTGRRPALRTPWGNPWGFESPRSHS